MGKESEYHTLSREELELTVLRGPSHPDAPVRAAQRCGHIVRYQLPAHLLEDGSEVAAVEPATLTELIEIGHSLGDHDPHPVVLAHWLDDDNVTGAPPRADRRSIAAAFVCKCGPVLMWAHKMRCDTLSPMATARTSIRLRTLWLATRVFCGVFRSRRSPPAGDSLSWTRK